MLRMCPTLLPTTQSMSLLEPSSYSDPRLLECGTPVKLVREEQSCNATCHGCMAAHGYGLEISMGAMLLANNMLAWRRFYVRPYVFFIPL